MKALFDKFDLWVYQLMGWLFLLTTCLTEDPEQSVYLVGAGALFGIQAIIWRLNDSKPK